MGAKRTPHLIDVTYIVVDRLIPSHDGAGLLPYFFLRVNDPKYAYEANRCIYNNMFDNPECKNATMPMVKNVHFTVCQKPWSCFKHDRNVACNAFLDKWHELREEVSACG